MSNPSKIAISLLDFGIFKTPGQSSLKVYQLFEIAKQLEALSYQRLWLGEHHENDIAWRSPEILIGLLLASTENLRIGSAGNLLLFHNPLRLAQDYSLLESMFKNRVDMGLAGAPTTEPTKSILLNHSAPPLFEEVIDELFAFFESTFDKKDRYHNLMLPPYEPGLKPEVWMLATSNSKFEIALKHQANYAWSVFHKTSKALSVENSIQQYEDLYYAQHGKLPKTALAFSGICLSNRKRVRQISSSLSENMVINVAGNIEECKSQLEELLYAFQGTKELVLCDLSLSLEEKQENTEAFAEILKQITG